MASKLLERQLFFCLPLFCCLIVSGMEKNLDPGTGEKHPGSATPKLYTVNNNAQSVLLNRSLTFSFLTAEEINSFSVILWSSEI
jgi:hypothetical protein